MSQIDIRRNLISIDSICELYSAAQTTASVVKEIISRTKTLQNKIKTQNNSKSISNKSTESPAQIFESFKRDFDFNISKLSKTSDVDERISTVLETISETPFLINDSIRVKEKVTNLISANKSNYKQSTDSLLTEVKKQHCEVFSSKLAEIVSNASRDTGFKTVEIKTHRVNPVIIALDKTGRGIVSEISIDKKSMQIDLISETVGMNDGSCNDIMQKFGEALRKYGVKFSSNDKKFTGGSCQNFVTKEIDSNTNAMKRKASDIERLRNQTNKLKIGK